MVTPNSSIKFLSSVVKNVFQATIPNGYSSAVVGDITYVTFPPICGSRHDLLLGSEGIFTIKGYFMYHYL